MDGGVALFVLCIDIGTVLEEEARTFDGVGRM
jgi:hypothetical protein